MDIFSAHHVHLTGIKGVAMTSISQCLRDMEKMVTGSDLEEDFVTQHMLRELNIPILPFINSQAEFEKLQTNNYQLSTPIDLLIYTSAHGGPNNPEVQWAKQQNIPTLSQAEALSQLFNSKTGIAVCGVGGKSTVSAMIVWMLHQLNQYPSYSIGVGNIIGLNKTGKWDANSQFFVAEADEYVIDPQQKPPVPRFSFLQSNIIVCTNLHFDHPDVYDDFEMTKRTFLQFFLQLKAGGILIINGDDENLVEVSKAVQRQREDIKVVTFGKNPTNMYVIDQIHFSPGISHGQLKYENEIQQLNLSLPGEFNMKNATAALVAVSKLGFPLFNAVQSISTFQSTQRRFEFKGHKQNVWYYDDYAHHPHEITSVIRAIKEWYPDYRCVIAFQPHTFSRTIALRKEFVQALSTAEEVVILDIFPSAREKISDEISSDDLVSDIKKMNPKANVMNLKTIEKLTEYCLTQLKPHDVMITLGAGDIYKVHDKI